VAAIAGGSSVREAAKNFNIPRRLFNHIKSGSAEKVMGRCPILSIEEEKELCAKIFQLRNIRVPITAKVVRSIVYSCCEMNSITNLFNIDEKRAGRKWLKLFLKRHPEVARQKSQNLNPVRAAKMNRFIIDDYFNKQHNVVVDIDIMQKPQLIFNIDKKGCCLSLHKTNGSSLHRLKNGAPCQPRT
jgi:hypothetical protein